MLNYRIRIKVNNKFTRTAASYIKKGDLLNYEVSKDGNYIFKYLSENEYKEGIKSGDWKMAELNLEAELDLNYKGKL